MAAQCLFESRTDDASLLATPVFRSPDAAPVEAEAEVCYRAARHRWELEQAYRLIYKAYVRCGYLTANTSGIRYTPHDAVRGAMTFIAAAREEVIGTVTLVPDSHLGLPLEHIYSSEVEALRCQGRIVAEVTGLADRRKSLLRGLDVFIALTRMMIHYAMGQRIDDLLIAINPRHRDFYTKYLQFEQFGPQRSYASVQDHPAIGFRLDLRNSWVQQFTNRRVYDLYFSQTPEVPRRPYRRHPRDIEYFRRLAAQAEPLVQQVPCVA